MAGPVVGDNQENLKEILLSLSNAVGFSLKKPFVSMKMRVYRSEIVRCLRDLGFESDASEGVFRLGLVEHPPSYVWSNAFGKHERQAVKYYSERSASFGFCLKEVEFDSYLNL